MASAPKEIDSGNEVAVMKEGGGFECEFVDKPPEIIQTKCPVCLQILREPHQVTCCGKSFCRVCIGRIKGKHKPCPTCNKKDIKEFPNKGLQQPLYQQKVRCSHQKEGCEWTGELGELDNHLNLKPETYQQLQGCLFVEIECRYNFAGCATKLPRKDMENHIQESSQQHISLLEAKHRVDTQDFERFRDNIQRQFPTPPVTLTMTRFKYHSEEKVRWTSPPFYTRLRGYKMCIQVDVGLQHPLSLQMCMMEGEFDSTLRWGTNYAPMEITVEVVSQVSWEPNKSISINCQDRTIGGSRFYLQNQSCREIEGSGALIQPEDMYKYVKHDAVTFLISEINVRAKHPYRTIIH